MFEFAFFVFAASVSPTSPQVGDLSFCNQTSAIWCVIGMAIVGTLWAFCALLKKIKSVEEKGAVDITEMSLLLETQKAMVNCQQILLRENDFANALFTMQKILCEQTKASRSLVVRFNCEKNTINILSEYGTDGNNDVFKAKTEYEFKTKPNWKERFANRDICEFPNLPYQTDGLGGDWLSFVEARNIKSFYAQRIMFGETLWGYIAWFYENSPHKISNAEGKFVNAFANYIELSLAKKQEQCKLISAMELAKKADIAKSFFIASISHEIRTPLNAVIGFAELLRDGNVSEAEQKEYIDSIAYGANSLLLLVNDVLDLSKLEANQMEIIKEDCDLKSLGESVMRVFAHKAAENKIELKIDMDGLPILQLDKLRIRQILFNFIGNAIKFSKKGSITLGAKFAPSLQNASVGELDFYVKDTGIGIPEKDIDRLLEPFVQLSKLRGTNASNNGTGLGLPICKRLVEKMNGKIIVESRENVGSVFTVKMQNVCAGKSIAPSCDSSGDCQTKNYANLSVLLVDDVSLNLKVMKSMCEKIGVSNVSIASSAAEALEKISAKQFDIVLTDMWMPEIDGAELARKIHLREEFAKLPIVAVTADEEANNNFDMREFCDVLLKPFTRDKLNKVFSHIGV